MTVTPAALGGVPVAEITTGRTEPRHVITYFHGGVYVLGDAAQAAGLAAQIARRTAATVISVDYRLAPEHPYPAALDDALAAYQALLEADTDPAGYVRELSRATEAAELTAPGGLGDFYWMVSATGGITHPF